MTKKFLSLLLLGLLCSIGNMWGANVEVTYTYESSAAKATMATNAYFSAASNPVKGTNGTFSNNSGNLRCELPKSTSTTITFTYTAKTDIEVSSFTINSFASSDKIKSASVDYKVNSGAPTSENVDFNKSSLSDVVITPESAISLSTGDVFSIIINLSNTDDSKTRNWNLHTITLSASIPGVLSLSVEGDYIRNMALGFETAIEVSADNASGSETYQWYRTISTDTECSSGSSISGETSTSFTPDEESAGTCYYYCVVTDGLNTAKTELITVTIEAPLTGWVVFDGLVDTETRPATITHDAVSMTYSTSTPSIVDVSGKTNSTGHSYQKGIQLSKSTGGYLSFTIPSGYTATFVWAFSGTGNRTIMLASSNITETSDAAYIATLTDGVKSDNIVGGEYTTPLAAGTYYICEGGAGNWQIDGLSFTLEEVAGSHTITLYDNNGGISNGSATATEGSNVLSSLSAPIWAGHSVVGYYKEAECTNLIADAEGNLQASTDYTDGSGNWTSTSNQTLYAKWMTANNATFSDGAYIIGGSALNLNSLFDNGNGEAVTYSVKDPNGTGATIAGSMFTATAAGTATVTATQAASASVAGATLDAEITVSVNPLGNHVITYTLDVTTSEDSKKTDINSTNESSSSYLNTLVGITNNTGSAYTKGSKANLTVKIPTDESYEAGHYMSVGFSVSSGYKFIPTSVSIKAQPVTTAKTVKLVLTDGVNSVEKTQNSLTAGSITTVTMDNSERTMLSGTVTLKIYCYGATDTYRLGSPITISGIVVEETPVSVTLNGTAKYATYHNYSNAYVMPAGLEGIVVAGNEGATLTLNTAYNAGDIVPAHEPLILHAADIDENTNFSLYLTYTASEPGANMLKGLAANGTTIGEGKHYHLSYDTEDPAGTVGFYYGAADGNPFSLNADKAYLVIPAGSSAPSRFLLNEEENNATDVQSSEANEKAVKFIENGQLLILRDGITYDALGRVIR